MTAPRNAAEDGAPARRGRRVAGESGRAQILAAATTQFHEHGYQGATIRAIAAEAGVDTKLVHYYFGTKGELFTAMLAAAFESWGFPTLLTSDSVPPGGSLGTAYLRTVLTALEESEMGPAFIGLVRNLGTHEESRRIFLNFISRELITRLTPLLPGEQTELRVTLVGSHLLGTVIARYVLRVPPLADLPRDELAAAIGPTLDRYLFGEIAGS
ncbi:TetR/AcrR family transcriptional regulator [Leucobacter chromiireducens]|uniref:TetR/AcrR family transcriptional regulator n=1 Tax=Leucobacter chromiireducens TaxID=283877 RepID=UPI000F635B14|nr:TetR family transcriptional regulator [Leucobacter chromiireducens]